MKELIQEFIQEKGRELIFISGSILAVLALAFGYSYIFEGGAPHVPDQFFTLESKIDRGLSTGLRRTDEATRELNRLLVLEQEGKKAEVLSQIEEAKSSLTRINSTVESASSNIVEASNLISEIKPRKARKPLSDALTYAALLGQNLLTFSGQMEELYDGLETRVKGEEFVGDYARLVQEVNHQAQAINGLREEYNKAIGEFYKLTDV